MISLIFIFKSMMLGVGLAMDAFSVSCANGLREPGMHKDRMSMIAGVYAFFQFMMPMTGWLVVRKAAEHFVVFQRFIPWISLILLLFIGGKMLLEGVRKRDSEEQEEELSSFGLIGQGVATSLDALSVGFTIEGYSALLALAASAIIAAVTFVICIGGLLIGRTAGTRLSGKASILGGFILIGIGLEIFLSGI